MSFAIVVRDVVGHLLHCEPEFCVGGLAIQAVTEAFSYGVKMDRSIWIPRSDY